MGEFVHVVMNYPYLLAAIDIFIMRGSIAILHTPNCQRHSECHALILKHQVVLCANLWKTKKKKEKKRNMWMAVNPACGCLFHPHNIVSVLCLCIYKNTLNHGETDLSFIMPPLFLSSQVGKDRRITYTWNKVWTLSHYVRSSLTLLDQNGTEPSLEEHLQCVKPWNRTEGLCVNLICGRV